jgi:pimeloyl-ACP methyl ester carboxylesterase
MTVHVNGIDLYCEQAGQGPPLILLHGNGESHRIFRRAMGRLAAKFTVYAIDSRGHGKSSRVEALHYADMAEDIAQFVEALGLGKPMLYGFSDGGIIGLLLAMGRPGLLSRMAISGANLTPGDLKPGMLRLIRVMYKLTRGCNWKLMLEEPDITPAQLGRIDVPVLVLAGEKDIIDEAHTRMIAGAIPGARLQILPGESHGSYVSNGAKLCGLIIPFFEEAV